jgi:hypothetical protein|mmetsp:Transcript_25640/g.43670  ORF Transcript_25640/g.43670 Transcript_25640/m.43670 type:complete len:85 (+) Transcript_25640:837-1091(+)
MTAAPSPPKKKEKKRPAHNVVYQIVSLRTFELLSILQKGHAEAKLLQPESLWSFHVICSGAKTQPIHCAIQPYSNWKDPYKLID